MAKKIILYLILAVSICGAVIFGKKIFDALTEYKKGNDIYDEIANIAYKNESNTDIPAVNDVTSTESPMMIETVLQKNSLITETPITETQVVSCSNVSCSSENSEHVEVTPALPVNNLLKSPVQVSPDPIVTKTVEPASQMNFTKLKEVNEDVKAWIHLDDSKVDYPILQYKDNDYYLHHAITGEWNKVGTPYVDYRCAGDFSDRITVVYGHYMENGTMFTDFHKYKSQKYFEEHPVIDLYTPSGDYNVLPVAGVFQNVEYWDFTFDFENDEAFLKYINNWKAVSTFKSNTEFTSDDKFIVLTLCTYDIENGRYMLIGKLDPR